MTDLYAVIGHPIAHSKSPMIHKAFAQATGQDVDYIAIEGPLGRFAATVESWRAKGLRGLNVTVPFKMDAFAYAGSLDAAARQAGAVNCLTFDGETSEGANYDGVGLVRDIEINLSTPVTARTVLILGTGGATRGALGPLLQRDPARLTVAFRSPGKEADLRALFPDTQNLDFLDYGDLARDGDAYDLVLNATSASLFGEAPAVPLAAFSAKGLAYDLAYGKGLTPFLRLAREAGVEKLADGVGMLVEQAAEAFERWRGVRPETRSPIEKLKVPLV
jgi:shikimate dehydrogenase